MNSCLLVTYFLTSDLPKNRELQILMALLWGGKIANIVTHFPLSSGQGLSYTIDIYAEYIY